MAAKSALMCSIVLFALAFSASVPVEKFINSSFEPDQNVTLQPLLGGNFTLVSADGVETYVLDSSSGKPVADRGQLAGMLASDIKERSGFGAMLASALSFADGVSAAKQPEEAKCMQYLGVDMHDCNDKQSCTVACFSVPQCDAVVRAGGFIEAMQQWNSDRKSFDSLLSSYSQSVGNVSSDPSAMDRQLSILSQLSALSSNLSSSPLFLNSTDYGCANGTARCFNYCPKANYSSGAIAAKMQNLALLKAQLAQVSAQSPRASAILANGSQNDKYLSTRSGKFQDLQMEALNGVRTLTNKSAQTAGKVSDPAVQSALAAVSNLSSQISTLGQAGLYRQALALKPRFEQASSAAAARIDSDVQAYSALSTELGILSATANNSGVILGGQSAASYSAQISGLQSRLASPMSLQDIASAAASAEQIKGNLTSEIAQKLTGGVQSSLPSKLPCLPGLALLAVLGFVTYRRD